MSSRMRKYSVFVRTQRGEEVELAVVASSFAEMQAKVVRLHGPCYIKTKKIETP